METSETALVTRGQLLGHSRRHAHQARLVGRLGRLGNFIVLRRAASQRLEVSRGVADLNRNLRTRPRRLPGDVCVLVLTNWEYRERLGGPGTPEFDIESRKAKAEWRRLFVSYPAYSGDEVDDYVTENSIPD